MSVRATLLEDPAAVLEKAGDFLREEPVLHNLILTLLETRIRYPEPGRYWVATRCSRVSGVAFQSPLNHSANLSTMDAETIAALVDRIAEAGISLPAVGGEAATAARFAGQWTERSRCGATPSDGQRIYEIAALNEIAPAEGRLRKAEITDRDLLVRWQRASDAMLPFPLGDAERRVDIRLAAGQMWVWDVGTPVSMAANLGPAAGVYRIAAVYTPPEKRRNGYAAACVHALTGTLLDSGHRVLLYTELANPTSNSIYRRLGYKAVAEIIRYRFET